MRLFKRMQHPRLTLLLLSVLPLFPHYIHCVSCASMGAPNCLLCLLLSCLGDVQWQAASSKKKSDVYSRGSPGRALSVSHMISLPHKSPPPPPPPPLRPWSTYVKWKCNVCRACEPYSRGNGVQRRKVEQFVSSCRRCRCSSTEVCSKLFSETVRCFLSPLQWVGGTKKKRVEEDAGESFPTNYRDNSHHLSRRSYSLLTGCLALLVPVMK